MPTDGQTPDGDTPKIAFQLDQLDKTSKKIPAYSEFNKLADHLAIHVHQKDYRMLSHQRDRSRRNMKEERLIAHLCSLFQLSAATFAGSHFTQISDYQA